MKTLNKTALRLTVLLTALLCVAACDVQYKNGGGFLQTEPENPRYKVVEIEGSKFIAYQTSFGYWNYSPIGVCGK